MTASFESLIQEPRNELIEKALDEGRIPIGYTCSYVPEVLLSTDRLFPVRLRAPGVAGTEIADIYLSSVICSYTRSILEFAMDDRYDFLGGWVFAASCDHLRRLYDNLSYLRKPDFIHILDVPHRTGPAALKWYIDELSMLRNALADKFEVDNGDRVLEEAIERHNIFAALLTSIGDLRKEKQPPISGAEFHHLLMAAATTPKDLFHDAVVRFRDSLPARKGISDYRARLMLVGGQMDDPEYIRVIESSGGLVVADRICTGSMPGLAPIARNGDPLSDIAVHSLTGGACPRMMEDFDQRVKLILTKAREFLVDGIIIEFVKFCDTWGVESSPLVKALRDAGLPVLCLEREYRMTGEGQLRTRVQAFIESMGK